MIQLKFVPIENWPSERTRARKVSPFRSTYIQTLDLLETELFHLRAREAVLQAALSWQDLRNDGLPRSDAKFSDPGVILTFETPTGSMSFPCDHYAHWQCNLRAIALSLQALRAVDRYGVTRRAEQYQGWKKLPPPSDQPFATKEEAALFMWSQAYPGVEPQDIRVIITSEGARQAVYINAARRLHPDAGGGNHELFVRLQAAATLLNKLEAIARPH